MSKKKRSRSRSHFPRPSAPAAGLRSKSASAKIGPAPKTKTRAAVAGLIVLGVAVLSWIVFKPSRSVILRDSSLNVLLITLDTTRADRLGAYGYAQAKTPNLDALAANGVRFANAYAPTPLTLPSHTTMMTGLTPARHGVHNNGSYLLGPETTTLAEIFKEKGVKTAAFVSSFSIDSRFGLDQGFDLYDDNFQVGSPFKAVNAERKAEQVYKLFENWISKAGRERFFAWVHFFDPHLPYNPPSPYREQFSTNPYDGEIAYMDFIVGAVMKTLRDRNLLNRTLVVIAGDHGESFGEKGESGHGVFIYEETVRIPLILYAEGHLPPGRVVSSRVRLADIFPTVLDLNEIPFSGAIQGESLLPLIQKKSGKDRDVLLETFYPRENFGWSPLTGLISGPWKYIQAPRPELYNIEVDPGESKNLVASESRTASSLKAGLGDQLTADNLGQKSSPRKLSAEEKNRLRSLGYVDYSDSSSTGEDDPKDKRDELKMIQDAEKAEFQGDFAKAVALHEKMLDLRPQTASSYINLALTKARLKQFDEAIIILKKGLDRLPGNELLMSRLGFTYLVMGRLDDALASMKDLLLISPQSIDALSASAVILDGQGRKEDAQSYFKKALALEPENKFLRQSYAGTLASAGAWSEAIDLFEALIKEYPQDVGLYRAVGIAYGMRGDFDKAIENFKQITYIAPVPDAYYNLAISYRQKGDRTGAISAFERYLDDPKNEPAAKVQSARTELARLKAQTGR